MLADKVSGDLAGIWLLVAEHLRLGTWDLLCGWTGSPGECVQPRLALQLVHEAAVCTAGIRSERTLNKRAGFELANGLPFLAADPAVHELLASRTVAECQRLQVALGKLRRVSGHFEGKLLAIDPHRIRSHSKRHMRERVENKGERRPQKRAQTFWMLDASTCQPVCFTSSTASRSVTGATSELLDLAEQILQPSKSEALVLADSEHFAGELLLDVRRREGFELLTPLPNRPAFQRQFKQIPPEAFTPRWAGLATTKLPYQMERSRSDANEADFWQFVQRTGERPEDWRFQGFVSTADTDEAKAMTDVYPVRWHVEEFFKDHQPLGWKRAGTMNLNIRYGQMTMALIAQTVIYQLRERLGEPYDCWDANHMAKDLFFALEADVRVHEDVIIVTYYNAPEALRRHYENLPAKLEEAGVEPTIPWLYHYKLDFRFR